MKLPRLPMLVRRNFFSLKTIRPALLLLLLLTGAAQAQTYTSNDADTLFSAFNTAFLIRNGASLHYAETQTDGTTYFWGQAEEIEGALDAYDRTYNPDHLEIVRKLLHGFVDTNGKSWKGNEYNDDCMWACIAFSRAYLATGDEWFSIIAKSNFDMVYARAWDTSSGGMWWKTDNKSKNACVNGPGAIAAYYLYMSTGDSGYLSKANAIYDWERAHLFGQTDGKVYDNIDSKGNVATVPTTYNQGTFIGAAYFLGHDNDAVRATDFTMNEMGTTGPHGLKILSSYGVDNNNTGFNGIAIRWIAKFVMGAGRQKSYLPWLQANAQAAWDVRRTSDNLSWCDWTKPTPPDKKFHSWDCISSVVALQDIPPLPSVSSP